MKNTRAAHQYAWHCELCAGSLDTAPLSPLSHSLRDVPPPAYVWPEEDRCVAAILDYWERYPGAIVYDPVAHYEVRYKSLKEGGGTEGREARIEEEEEESLTQFGILVRTWSSKWFYIQRFQMRPPPRWIRTTELRESSSLQLYCSHRPIYSHLCFCIFP